MYTERVKSLVPRAGQIVIDVEELDATDPGDDFDLEEPETEEQPRAGEWRMPKKPYKYIPES